MPFDLRGKHIGFNCSTCHTGEIHYRGQTLLVAGGAGLVDVQRLVEELTRSAEQTLMNRDGKRDRFKARVTTANKWPLQLEAALSVFVLTGKNFMPARASLREGFGRSDTISKGIAAMKALDPRNNVAITAPVSVPPLWQTDSLESFHVSGAINQRLARDMAAGIGGGIGLSLFGSDRFRSNIDLDKLSEVHELLTWLQPPAWPEDVLGAVDYPRAKAGAEIYAQQCAQCHDVAADGGELLQVETPLDEVGTDRAAAERLSTKAYGHAIGIGGLGGVSAARFFQELTGAVAERAMDDRGLSHDERQQLTQGEANIWSAKQSYKASLLAGIWATAPYLHNGSVKSLRELLLPSEQRSTSFRFCIDTEYDPAAVGLADETRGKCFFFDTRIAGNSARGHDYGVGLSDDDREALLEYLKTL